MQKNTEEFMNEIIKYKSLDALLNQKTLEFETVDCSDYLNELLKNSPLSKSEVIKKAELNQTTGYQYFDGKRRPTRSKMICLGLAFELNLFEMDRMLKKVGFAELYPKNSWDAHLIWALVNRRYSIIEIDSTLYQQGLPTLSKEN